MSEWIAMAWPFLVILVVLFIVIRVWMALVDTAFLGLKRVLGIKPKEIAWHTLEKKEDDMKSEE